jgi:peptide/nickel transport system substrate-binding protein
MRANRAIWRLLIALFALAMIAAACGDDDSGGGVTGDTADEPAEEPADEPADEPAEEPAEEPADEPADEAAEEPMSDELIIAVTTEPSTLDAQVVNDRAARVITGNISESLLFRDRGAQLVAGLAESWENVDETTWQFTLRQGVTFHDGSPFNAEAAAYSINRMTAEDFETQRSSYISGILSAEVVDEYTVNVLTDGPDAILPLQMAQVPMVPNGAGDEMNDHPIGTGPYQFVEWNRGQSITAEAFDGYWGEGGTIPRFTVRVIPDAQTALAALQNGEVHLVLDILPEQVSEVPQYKNVGATEFSYVAFNTYVDEMSDPRVRVAMNMAVDKELMAETLYGGFARPNNAQHLTPESLGFNADIGPFPYDPEGARDLLAEAGYPDGFEVTMNVPIGRYLRGEESAQLIAQQLEDIGLTVELVEWEWNEYRDAGRIPGTEEGALDLKYGWNSNEWFDGARTASHVTCEGTSSKICDPIVDENFEIGATTTDQDARDAAYQAAWAELHENPHAIYLLQQDLIYGMAENLVWEPRLDDEYYVSEMSLS